MKKLIVLIVLLILITPNTSWGGYVFDVASVKHVNVADSDSLDCTAVTISFWICITGSTSPAAYLVSKMNAIGDQESYSVGVDSTRHVFIRMSDTGGNIPGDTSLGTLNLDTLYHIGVTYQTGTFKLYIDSVDSPTNDSSAASGTIFQGTAPLIFSGRGAGASFPFNGYMFGIRIYNRVLSPAEIQILFEHRGSDNITDGLVTQNRLNEFSEGATVTGADSAIDISGNGNHGTPSGSPVGIATPMRLIKR